MPSVSRRGFMQTALSFPAVSADSGGPTPALPWYRRTFRWGQTNITERDPVRYDIAWWRSYWKRTRVQGVIINAGGIVAYYPSRIPLHRRAEFLGDRDLYGELAKAAHEDGLAVLARMDSNRAAEDFYRAHPEWFAVDANGKPYRAGELYVACVHGPYYEEHIPAILREIIDRTRPEGITDNSWSGLGRESICCCANCRRKFQEKSGRPLPEKADWNSPAYRDWIRWNYQRRLEIWDLNNRTTRSAGGPDCLWIGMNSGSVSGQSRSFRDYREIGRRAEIIMLDHQSRSDSAGFQQNAESGKLIHGLLGWDKLIPESMAMYQAGRTSFRLSSKPAAEARMWMVAGFAGGIQPWWHHVGAYHEDRRMYRTAEPIYRWYQANEEYLVNRRPMATVGVVWSQRNTDFYGREEPGELVENPYRGMIQALVRARVPYLPVHADDIERDSPQLAVLVLPSLAAVSDSQCEAIRRFVRQGGALIATGASTLLTEWGDPRPDFALADLFGAHAPGARLGSAASVAASHHTYFRLSPELRGRVDGPRAGDEPAPAGARHPILQGFDETDILPYGGMLDAMAVDRDAEVLMTFVPPFPVFPPETAWMKVPKTDIPALIVKGRTAFLPADVDRRFARENLPDHGDLLANLIRWAAAGRLALRVEGRGLVDCHLYRQKGRLILHVVNLTGPGAWRAPIDELIPVGPLQVKVRLPEDVSGKEIRLLVSAAPAKVSLSDGWAVFTLPSVSDHEVAVIS